jgi:hypothetical protein
MTVLHITLSIEFLEAAEKASWDLANKNMIWVWKTGGKASTSLTITFPTFVLVVYYMAFSN